MLNVHKESLKFKSVLFSVSYYHYITLYITNFVLNIYRNIQDWWDLYPHSFGITLLIKVVFKQTICFLISFFFSRVTSVLTTSGGYIRGDFHSFNNIEYILLHSYQIKVRIIYTILFLNLVYFIRLASFTNMIPCIEFFMIWDKFWFLLNKVLFLFIPKVW